MGVTLACVQYISPKDHILFFRHGSKDIFRHLEHWQIEDRCISRRVQLNFAKLFCIPEITIETLKLKEGTWRVVCMVVLQPSKAIKYHIKASAETRTRTSRNQKPGSAQKGYSHSPPSSPHWCIPASLPACSSSADYIRSRTATSIRANAMAL